MNACVFSSTTVLSGAEKRVAEERPGWNFQIFLRMCQSRNLKIRTVWIIVCEMCADLALGAAL